MRADVPSGNGQWRRTATVGGANDFPLLDGNAPGQARLRIAAKQIICKQGDPADALFYIESGRVKISRVSRGGKEAVVGVCGPGEFFGLVSLAGGRSKRATDAATALTDCAVIQVKRSAMIRLLREQQDFAVNFVACLIRQDIRNQEMLIDQLTHSAEQRLVRVLLQLADGGGFVESDLVYVNQTLLAGMVGTTRSQVNAFMNKFKRRGLVDYDRRGILGIRPALRDFFLDISTD